MKKHKVTEAGDGFDPRVSLALERVLVARDYFVLSSMLKHEKPRLLLGLGRLEKTIAKNGATEYLDEIAVNQSDRYALLWLLQPFSRGRVFPDVLWSKDPGPGSIKKFLGISAKKLAALTTKMREIGSILDVVNEQPEFSALLMLSRELYSVYRLPGTLRTGSRLLRYVAENFVHRVHIYDNIAKARLTSFVLSKVQSAYAEPKIGPQEYRDEAVASLITAVSDDLREYDAVAHRMWRRKHYQRLRALDPDLDRTLPEMFSQLT